MNLNAEQLETIEEMAELFYSPADIAVNLEVDTEDFTLQVLVDGSEIQKAFFRGYYKGDIALRKSIAKAAENGSNPAQQMMREIQNNNKPAI